MSDPFVAEIRIFAGNFAPTGWATCDGQILPISQNTALFSLLGTFYGGNGQSTFALPNLQDSVPIFWGQGGGLSDYSLGQQSGTDTVTLLTSEMPLHSHNMMASNEIGEDRTAVGEAFAQSTGGAWYLPITPGQMVDLSDNPPALTIAGSSFPHNNDQPYLTLTFIIAMQGVFPPRT
jgi:microcystin-dependent protein